ncbi:MAG TPA: iron ABC transporter permease [Anaerolineaceae bacterium]
MKRFLGGGAAGRLKKICTQPVIWLWAAPFLFLAYFFFYPLISILGMAGQAALSGTLKIDFWGEIWPALVFTVWQAVLSTLLTMLVGLPAAFLFARFRFWGKSLLRVVTTLPFILPTVVVAASFNALLGPRGWLNLLLMGLFDLNSAPVQILNTLPAILLAHVFYNTTIVIRVAGSAWAQLDPRLEQAGRILGASAWRNFREITLPLLRPSLLASALLVFLFDFTSFGVILLMGGPKFSTLEVEIYLQTMQNLNLPAAGLLSVIQLLFTLGLGWLSGRLGGERNIPLLPRLKGEGMRSPESWRARIFVAGMTLFLLLLLVLPLAALAGRSITRLDANRGERGTVTSGLTLDYYQELFVNSNQSIFYVPPVEAARNSLGYALAAVAFSMFLGTLASFALNRRLRANRYLNLLLMLPIGTSAVTLGLGFLVVFNGPPVDVRTFPLLIPIAHSLVALPFVVHIVQPALASIPGNLRQAAAVLGAPPWRVWLEVDLPVVGRALLVGGIFAFTISLGEFGATSFLARPEYPTLPIAIYRFLSLPGALNYGQALAMATILMLICGASIFIMERISIEE